MELKDWVLVLNPGTDTEKVLNEFSTYIEAAQETKSLVKLKYDVDIYKKIDGSLSTEF